MSDPYITDHAACGTDYEPGKNAFQAAEDRRQQTIERATPSKQVAALFKKATRVNEPNFHIQTVAQSQAMQDKARKLTGKSAGGAR